MIVANISAIEMADVIQSDVNGSDFQSAITDAVAHVGWMITGEKTPLEISDFQDRNLRASEENSEYIRGYTEAWKALHTLLF
jgi:hypothetical protein